jgi:hypothetical protein
MKKRRSPRRYVRNLPRNCEPGWSIAQRLAHYFRIDPISGCHIWQGHLVTGYGVLRNRGKDRYAHRVAWESKHGPIPDGMVLRHRCNVRSCCNPDHLVPGTRAENNADLKAERLRWASARAATARGAIGGARLSPIRIFLHGVEIKGDVEVNLVDPEIAKGEERNSPAAAPVRAKRAA